TLQVSTLTSWMTPGVSFPVYIEGIGTFTGFGGSDSSTINITNDLNYPGNAVPGTAIPVGTIVVAGSPVGATGPIGLSAFTTTYTPFTQPAVGQSVRIDTYNFSWTTVGEIIYV